MFTYITKSCTLRADHGHMKVTKYLIW